VFDRGSVYTEEDTVDLNVLPDVLINLAEVFVED
jgi:hypothetical protein